MIYRALRRLDAGDDAGPETWRVERRRSSRSRRGGLGLPLALTTVVVLPALVVVVLLRPESLINGSLDFRWPVFGGTGTVPAIDREPAPAPAPRLTGAIEVAALETAAPLAVPGDGAGDAAPSPAAQQPMVGGQMSAAPVELPHVELDRAEGALVITDVAGEAVPVRDPAAAPDPAPEVGATPSAGLAPVVESASRVLKPESALRTASADVNAYPWQRLERLDPDGGQAADPIPRGGPRVDIQSVLESGSEVLVHEGRATRTQPQWADPAGGEAVDTGGSGLSSYGGVAGIDAGRHVPASGSDPADYMVGYGPDGAEAGYISGSAWVPRSTESGLVTHGEPASAGEMRMSVDQVAKGRVTQTVARDLNRAIRRGDTALADELMAVLSNMAGADSTIVLKTRAYRHLVEDDGQDSVAMQLLNEVLIRDPSDLDASLNIALLEIRGGLMGDARKRLDSLARAHPDDPRVLSMLASLR